MGVQQHTTIIYIRMSFELTNTSTMEVGPPKMELRVVAVSHPREEDSNDVEEDVDIEM